jgi:hypothetical protein
MGKESDAVQPAEIVREYGPFPGVPHVHGVSFDGSLVWFASGEKLQAFEPASGRIVRALDVACDAGTAFDGRHLFQIAGDRIQKIDPATGEVLSTIRPPAAGVTRGWRGARVRCGSGNTATGRSTRSIPTLARSCARSSRTASSPESPGWTASSGTGPGKATTPTSAGSTPRRERC